MHRFNCVSIVMLTLLVTAAGCLSAGQPAPGTGAALQNKPAQKIISLSPSSTEIVYYLGLQERLLGVTEYCNYPPEAKTKPRVGGFSTVDVEKVVSLQPDLVLAADIHSKSITPMLEKLGFNVITFSPKTMDSMIADFKLLSDRCGVTEQAGQKITALKSRIDSIYTKTSVRTEDKRRSVLVVIWHDPLRAAAGNTLVDDIVRLAGGVNIAGRLEGYANLNIESVISADPQVIIMPASMGDSGSKIRDAVTQDSRLRDVAAVRNNAIYTMDGDVLLRYGPRSADALQQIAALLYPDLFPEIKTVK